MPALGSNVNMIQKWLGGYPKTVHIVLFQIHCPLQKVYTTFFLMANITVCLHFNKYLATFLATNVKIKLYVADNL